MSNQKQEHRAFSRITFDAKSIIIGKDQQWDTELLDISLKGALVQRPSSWDFALNTSFGLDIKLSEDTVIHMDATVAHIEDDHIGFCCDHIDLESITHLRRIVELNTGNDDLLHRELSALNRK
jgi:hypothetical protein